MRMPQRVTGKMDASLAGLGVSRPRADSEEKVRGRTQFAADLPIAGLLYARVVPSVYAHARIRSINTTSAVAIPGVVAVLTAADLPIVGSDNMRAFEPLARTEVLFAGQPVALVVAETESAAADAVDQVVVDLEPLPTVVDLVAAMALDSPPARLVSPEAERATGASMAVHAAVGTPGAELFDEVVSANVFSRKRYVEGDIDRALAGADRILSATFRTNWVYQGAIEPHSATAWVDADGTLALATATQGIFYAQKQIAKIFGLPFAKVRVKGLPLGGSFGSKILVADPLVAAAALVLRRPVRLTLTRREDIAAANPAPGCLIELRIGAYADGRLAALKAWLAFDAGAYTEWSTEGTAAVLIGGPYRWEAFDVRAYGVRTNRFGTGSYRAPGAAQAAFALESLIDEMATALEIDPIEFRLQNLVEAGDPMIDGTPWPPLGHREVLDAISRHPLWRNRSNLPSNEGIGVASFAWPASKEPAAALCRLNPGGTLSVVTGAVDMTGSNSSLAAIAAETFGLAVAAIEVICLDTDGAPQTPLSGGSTAVYSVGKAVRDAAADARRKLLAYVAELMEIDPGDLEIVDGMVRPVGSPDLGKPVVEVLASVRDYGGGPPPFEGHATTSQTNLAPSTVAHLAHVRLDPETGNVRVLAYAVAQDAGKAINPALVEGQMRGGATQGIGWALHEALLHDENGQLMTGSLMDYALPRSTSIPPIDTLIVEVPSPDGPFGAKGIGEASIIPAGAAIASAIVAAGGPRLRSLPMTGSRVWSAMATGTKP
jgi:CO/xanthine dehydrogenase Mo-binding subunit